MPKDLLHERGTEGQSGAPEERTVSRREFLKLAGVAGAALGAGSGIAALVASCGGEETTTTTAGGSSSTSSTLGSGTTVGQSSTTSVSASAEIGAEIRLGVVSAKTGSLASFGVPDDYCASRWKEYIGDGIVCGDGKKHPVAILTQDTQSDTQRAARVAGDLIAGEKVHIVMVAGGPDTVVPVVQQAEVNSTPVVSTDCVWQPYLGQNKEYKWAYHAFFGAEDAAPMTIGLLNAIPNNKKCGLLFDNTIDGNTFLPFYDMFLKGAGFETVDGGQFQPLAEDFTAQISAFKKAGCETLAGNCNPGDFTNFWKQASQQGLKLKTCTIGKALLFPEGIDALGNIGNGLMKELWWHRTYPWKSSLTGETCAQLADDFEAKTGKQQTAPLLHYVVGEMALYALKNATDPTDKNAIIAAIEKMKLDTIVGPVDFTAALLSEDPAKMPAGPGRKAKNVYGIGLGGAQWQMLGGKWKFTEVPVDKTAAPFIPDSAIQKVIPLAL